MEGIVTVAEFTESMEGEMAKSRLESAGIESFLSGENARMMEPGLGPLRLQVAAADEADARAILADLGTGDTESDLPETGILAGPQPD